MSRAPVSVLVVCVTVLGFGSPGGAADRLVPTPIGVGPEYHPPASNAAVSAHRLIDGLRCSRIESRRFGVHLEVFGRGLVVIVPAGIGVARPWRTVRPNVLIGRCSYAARTRTPIGVIEVAAGARLTLGQFFDIWGQPLDARRLLGFRARGTERVRGYVDGSPWSGAVRAIPLRRHAAITLELGTYVRPHPRFLFGMGL